MLIDEMSAALADVPHVLRIPHATAKEVASAVAECGASRKEPVDRPGAQGAYSMRVVVGIELKADVDTVEPWETSHVPGADARVERDRG